jgi:hypothetical protein
MGFSRCFQTRLGVRAPRQQTRLLGTGEDDWLERAADVLVELARFHAGDPR